VYDFGWSNHTPQTAKTVAKAFYAGRTCRRGNCRTDGSYYWLVNTIIARRIDDEDIPEAIIRVMKGIEMDRRLLEFSFNGWPTKMTARHLCALGVNASAFGLKSPKAQFRGIPVDDTKWYTPEEINELRLPPEQPKRLRREKFVNMTMELFPNEQPE